MSVGTITLLQETPNEVAKKEFIKALKIFELYFTPSDISEMDSFPISNYHFEYFGFYNEKGQANVWTWISKQLKNDLSQTGQPNLSTETINWLNTCRISGLMEFKLSGWYGIQSILKKSGSNNITRRTQFLRRYEEPSFYKYSNIVEAVSSQLNPENTHLIKYLPIQYIDENFAISAVSICGQALAHIPQALKTTQICTLAVQNDAFALQYVPYVLRTVEVCMLAMNPYAIQKYGEILLQWVPKNILTAEFYQKIINQSPNIVFYCPKIYHNFLTLSRALSYDGLLLREISQFCEYYANEDLCKIAIAQNPKSIAFVPKHIFESNFKNKNFKKSDDKPCKVFYFSENCIPIQYDNISGWTYIEHSVLFKNDLFSINHDSFDSNQGNLVLYFEADDHSHEIFRISAPIERYISNDCGISLPYDLSMQEQVNMHQSYLKFISCLNLRRFSKKELKQLSSIRRNQGWGYYVS